MDKVVKYIEDNLGIAVKLTAIDPAFIKQFPVFIAGMYKFYMGEINGQPVLFLKWLSDSAIAPGNFLKHENLMKKYCQYPVVFVFDSIPSYNKSRMTSLGINFIVTDSQIYLPELFIILSKNKKEQTKEAYKKLSPTAQTMLLYYLYGSKNDFTLAEIQDALNMPYPTVCKAVDLLQKLDLCSTVGYRNKKVHFENIKAKLLDRALEYMSSPVKRVVFSEKTPNRSCVSGIDALAEFTMINGQYERKQVAVSYEDYKKMDFFSVEDRFLPVCVEVWSYSPHLFSANGIVDKISLYLSLKEDNDERIQHELNKMIQQIW